MTDPLSRLRRFFRELKRRKVYRVGAVYAAVAFVLIQVADLTFVRLGLPAWTVTFIIVVAAVGFPLTLIMAWAFEVTPEGVRRTPGAELTEDEEVQAEGGLRTGYKVVVGLGLIAAAVAGGWYLTGGGGESPEVAEGTVAVLPFQVSGSGADTWRDGMVTMLSTKLDGAGGLRAISDRTVLAAWEESPQASEGAGTDEALGVARQVGAEYALVGSAVQLGEELRFTAALHDTRSGDRVGQVEVAGAPDSVTALTDSLARRTLGVLAEQTGTGVRSAGVASLTTQSLPALQAYLQAERRFRTGEYEEALRHYRRAIEQDSSFALAYARASYAAMWGEGIGAVRGPILQASDRAAQLPLRERRLLRARRAFFVENRALTAADSLGGLAEAYPDDPRVWYSLGEVIFHGSVPGGWPAADRAFERAVELEPGVTTYHIHLVDLSMSLHQDSALSARRIAVYPGQYKDIYQTFWDLTFGSPDRRRSARGRLDTIRPAWRTADYASDALSHPKDLEVQGEVYRAILGRTDVDAGDPALASARRGLRVNWRHRGQVKRALRSGLAEGADSRFRCALAEALSLGYPIPDSILRDHLSPSRLPEDAVPRDWACTGIYFIETGRTDELTGILEGLRRAMERDTFAFTATTGPWARELQGYRAFKAGNLKRAERRWSRSKPGFYDLGALWRGTLYRQLGQFERAEGWYLAAWRKPVAHQRLGQLYEEMDRPEDATAAYRRFIAAWEDADEELQPRVDSVRQRLETLTAGEPDE